MGSRTRVVKIGQNVWQSAQCFHTPVYNLCDICHYKITVNRDQICNPSCMDLQSLIIPPFCTGSQSIKGYMYMYMYIVYNICTCVYVHLYIIHVHIQYMYMSIKCHHTVTVILLSV